MYTTAYDNAVFFKAGDVYFVRAASATYIGRIKAHSAKAIVLSDASLVLAEPRDEVILLTTGVIGPCELHDLKHPVIIPMANLVDATAWPFAWDVAS